MGEYEEFLGKMNGIYESIGKRQAAALEAGLLPDPVLTTSRGGYFVAFQPSSQVAESLERIALNAGEIVPCVAYHAMMIHTTLAVYGQADGFAPSVSEERITFEKLQAAVAKVKWRPSTCRYDGILFDQTSAILKGVPDRNFFENAKRIKDALAKHGLEVSLPWGGHVTFMRFKHEAPAADAARLKAYFDKAAFPVEGFFNTVLFGTFRATPETFLPVFRPLRIV